MASKVRSRQATDDQALADMLSARGLGVTDMVFADRPTWVLEEEGRLAGFFTIRPEHGMPYVVHFAGEPGTGWKLARELKQVLRELGAQKALMNVRSDDKKLATAVQRVMGGKPYGARDGHTFFLVEVGHG